MYTAALCFYFIPVIFNGTFYVLSHWLHKEENQAIWAELFWYDYLGFNLLKWNMNVIDCAYLKQLDSL